jgi:hypothetical protein
MTTLVTEASLWDRVLVKWPRPKKPAENGDILGQRSERYLPSSTHSRSFSSGGIISGGVVMAFSKARAQVHLGFPTQ